MFSVRLDLGYQVMFGCELLWDELASSGHAAWGVVLKSHGEAAVAGHGNLQKWLSAVRSLPDLEANRMDFRSPAATFEGDCSPSQQAIVRQVLQTLRPWRKGPFRLFGVEVDAEWRSDQKWSRVARHIDLTGQDVLDVGCGNGYYGWRMLGAGAKRVVGLEPYPLYNLQYAIFKKFAPAVPNYVVPGSDRQLPDQPLALFDVAFSMGVLYHCRDPIGHLDALRRALKPGGRLVLETLVVEGGATTMLVPKNRYAKMRNVWCIPSTDVLCRLLSRTGFCKSSVVDVTVTTSDEQRRTPWMEFESLSDFLDPADANHTVEGYPRPRRALVVARTKPVR